MTDSQFKGFNANNRSHISHRTFITFCPRKTPNLKFLEMCPEKGSSGSVLLQKSVPLKVSRKDNFSPWSKQFDKEYTYCCS